VSGKTGAGYVAVVYGTKSGLDTGKRQIISQATDGIPGTPEASDYFGSRLTSGDFDGDGHRERSKGSGLPWGSAPSRCRWGIESTQSRRVSPR